MRKFLLALGIVVAFAIPAVAIAADLNESKFKDLIGAGEKCKGTDLGNGVIANGAWYHFVNNQLGNPGVADGYITVQWTDGTSSGPIRTSANVGPVQHFLVFSDKTLKDASTTLGGKLVLSSIECKKYTPSS